MEESREHERVGDWLRSSCDECGVGGLWVKLAKKHEPVTWLPALCSDCLAKKGA